MCDVPSDTHERRNDQLPPHPPLADSRDGMPTPPPYRPLQTAPLPPYLWHLPLGRLARDLQNTRIGSPEVRHAWLLPFHRSHMPGEANWAAAACPPREPTFRTGTGDM